MAAATDGLLNIDKPAGLTSHGVVRRVRFLSDVRRVGHTGTLDPLATGVLLLCVGRATRLAEYLVDLPKEYLATIRLGQETNTYDAEGEITREVPVSVSDRELGGALDLFRGEIAQVPPMFSALKVEGQPLYRQARQGLEIGRPSREVTIHELELLKWESPKLQVRVVCSSGTYIRSIAHDLGRSLGCGGHVTVLRRTAVGDFAVTNAVPLASLNHDNWLNHLLPNDRAVSHLPELALSADEALKLYHGQQIPRRPGQPEGPLARAYDPQDRFVGVVTGERRLWRSRKILYQPGEETLS